MKINIYDLSGKKIEDKEIKVDLKSTEEKDYQDLINRYIRVFTINNKQNTSHSKTKAEVSGGGRKPWNQKGTGRARAGSNRSPLWVGGGVPHGPRSSVKKVSLNKKMKKLVMQIVLSEKLKSNKVIGLNYNSEKISTKKANDFLKSIKLEGKGLIIHNNQDIYKSFRNIKNINIKNSVEVSPMDLLLANEIIVEKEVLPLVEEKVK